jgi:hypothetical protein
MDANLRRRLKIEETLLKQYFPSFRVQDLYGGPNPGAVGKLTSQSGKQYVIFLRLGQFPDEAPRMYVVSPKLFNHRGESMTQYGASGSMHTLAADEHGNTQICHYNGRFWNPRKTLYLCVMKGRLWLEAYEAHVRTGDDIDTWLGHM